MSITFTLIPYENFPLMFITFPIYTIGFIYGLIITTRYREILLKKKDIEKLINLGMELHTYSENS
jgi:hypothetical protein